MAVKNAAALRQCWQKKAEKNHEETLRGDGEVHPVLVKSHLFSEVTL